MTDDELDTISKRLLGAVDEVQRLERKKRVTPRSSPEFHELADTIEEKSRNVFAVAVEERELGEEDSPIPAERAEQHPGDWTGEDRATVTDGQRS